MTHQKGLSSFAADGIHTITTTPIKLFERIEHHERGVLFKAPGPTDPTPNTASVFISTYPGVTADQADSGGFPLAPGESIVLPVRYVQDWYAVAGSSQKLNWIIT